MVEDGRTDADVASTSLETDQILRRQLVPSGRSPLKRRGGKRVSCVCEEILRIFSVLAVFPFRGELLVGSGENVGK